MFAEAGGGADRREGAAALPPVAPIPESPVASAEVPDPVIPEPVIPEPVIREPGNGQAAPGS